MKSERRRTAVAGQTTTTDQTRNQILEAAEALFVEHGFKGVSMKDVADVLGITPAALYYHFPRGKEQLFAETIRHLLQVMLERAFAPLDALPPTASFRERLTLLTRNLLSLPVDRLAPLLRDAREYLKGDRPRFGRELMRDYSERMASVFREAQEAGAIASAYPAELLVTLHQGMCTSLLTRRHLRDDEPTDESLPEAEIDLAAMVVTTLLEGISPQGVREGIQEGIQEGIREGIGRQHASLPRGGG